MVSARGAEPPGAGGEAVHSSGIAREPIKVGGARSVDRAAPAARHVAVAARHERPTAHAAEPRLLHELALLVPLVLRPARLGRLLWLLARPLLRPRLLGRGR